MRLIITFLFLYIFLKNTFNAMDQSLCGQTTGGTIRVGFHLRRREKLVL